MDDLLSFSTSPQKPEQIIIPILETHKGKYYTVGTLHSLSGVSPDVIIQTASLHSEIIRKSLIKDENNQPVYTYNTPLSGVADIWNALRHTTYLKTKS